MDFLDSKKKKAHRIRLFIGYALMAVALSMSTVLIVLLTSGYDINRTTGAIIQNGLAIIDAHPEAADIFINGKPQGQTSQRLFLAEGNYDVKLQRAGYRDWSHKITLEGSTIEQLVYPFLFPTNLKTTTLKTYDSKPPLISQSPDRRWLVEQEVGKFGAFELVDLNDIKNPRSELVLPSDTVTAAPGEHIFKEVEWSADNTNLLIEHSWPTGTEYILLNRNNALQSLNVSKLFPDQAGFRISLRSKRSDQFYLYNPATKSLMSGVANTKVATAILAHAVQFKTYKEDTIIYINESKEVHLLQKDKDYAIRTMPDAPSYLLDYAEFNGKAYLVCGSPTDGHTYVYEDPLISLTRVPAKTPQPLRVLIVNKPEYVSFSTIARFVAVQSGSKFAVFDAETGRQFRYDTSLSVTAGQKATWMDGHRLALVANSKLNVFDFDGANSQQLGSILPLSQPYFNRDYDAFFTFSSNSSKVDMQRAELLVK